MNTTAPARLQFKSSDLSRHTPEVLAAAERLPIEVTRRDGDSFIVMSAVEASAREKLLEFAAQLVAATTDDTGGSLSDRLANHFPWMYALSDDGRDACAADLVRAARAAFSTQQAHLAVAEMAAWRATATALAAGLKNDAVEWLDDPTPVARP